MEQVTVAPKAYVQLPELLSLMDEIPRSACARMLFENHHHFVRASGSSHNHQAWLGGYVDHVTETMNVAVVLHDRLSAQRPLPFTLSDVLLVMFLHDLEKPWKGVWWLGREASKETRKSFRDGLIEKYLKLTPDQRNALRYVEGENEEYSSKERKMGPLAALCHMCDIASARLWPEHPLERDDPWVGASRSVKEGSSG